MFLTWIPNVPYPYNKTRISGLDPLGADEVYRQLPAVDAVADVPALALVAWVHLGRGPWGAAGLKLVPRSPQTSRGAASRRGSRGQADPG